jgi:hypothetical protein
MFAIYPKAAVESQRNLFAVHLAFLVILESNITDFICGEVEAVFSQSSASRDYWGHQTLKWRESLWDFYHYAKKGEISPFFANVTIRIDANRWPPFLKM